MIFTAVNNMLFHNRNMTQVYKIKHLSKHEHDNFPPLQLAPPRSLHQFGRGLEFRTSLRALQM